MLAEEQACAGASDWAACLASRLPTPRARGRRVRLSGRLGTAALKEMAKVIRDGHRTHCADVGAAGVSRWNPDSREERRLQRDHLRAVRWSVNEEACAGASG